MEMAGLMLMVVKMVHLFLINSNSHLKAVRNKFPLSKI